jgi:hypothetical protein
MYVALYTDISASFTYRRGRCPTVAFWLGRGYQSTVCVPTYISIIYVGGTAFPFLCFVVSYIALDTPLVHTRISLQIAHHCAQHVSSPNE